MEQLLSVAEFGRRLGGISAATVHTWLSHGRFGLQRTKVGRRTMLRESELEKVASDGGKSPAPKKASISEDPIPPAEAVGAEAYGR